MQWVVAAVLCCAVAAPVRADESNWVLIANLRSDDAAIRLDAARMLSRRASEEGVAVALIVAAKREHDHDALGAMLLALAESGAVDALGVIQLHAQSPAEDLRRYGRHALHRWLEVNRAIDADDELPAPPHPFYDRPPRPSPLYEPPPPGGVPPGFHFEEKGHPGLVIGGAVLFAGMYAPVAIGGTVGMANGDSEFAWLLLPGAGPIGESVYVFRHPIFGGPLLGGLLLVNAAGQLTGLMLLIVGLADTRPVLARSSSATPVLSVAPGGAALAWRF